MLRRSIVARRLKVGLVWYGEWLHHRREGANWTREGLSSSESHHGGREHLWHSRSSCHSKGWHSHGVLRGTSHVGSRRHEGSGVG
jgi:hypothetical protein